MRLPWFITVMRIGGYERAKHQFFAILNSAAPSMTTTTVCESSKVCGKHSLCWFVKNACIYALVERVSVHYFVEYNLAHANMVEQIQFSATNLCAELVILQRGFMIAVSLEPISSSIRIASSHSLVTEFDMGKLWRKMEIPISIHGHNSISTNAKSEIFS